VVRLIARSGSVILAASAGNLALCNFFILTKTSCFFSLHKRLYELRNKERISVAAASKMLCNIVYEYKGMVSDLFFTWQCC